MSELISSSDIDALQRQLEEFLGIYLGVKESGPFRQHEEIWRLMETFHQGGLLKTPAVSRHPHIRVKWSVGAGNWANVPWVALLDDRETNSTQHGVYAVFLFREDMSGVYLTLNQGVTDVIKQHGRGRARTILRERADRLGSLVPELADIGFSIDGEIDLRTKAGLGKDYEYSTIAYKLYPKGAAPNDVEINRDLEVLLNGYQTVLDRERDEIKPIGPQIQDPSEPPTASQRRIWLIAPGRDAEYWDELYRVGIIAIGWDEVGDLSQYQTIEVITNRLVDLYEPEAQPTNDARALYEFAHVMEPGDLVFAKKGKTMIVGHGEVTGDYIFDGSRRVMQHTRKVRWGGRGNWAFAGSLPVKTLTNITLNQETVQAIEEIVGLIAPDEFAPTPREQLQNFSVDDAMADLFMARDQFERILKTWRHKKNTILQGAPGVGKTCVAHRLAFALMGYRDRSRIGMVQFHQSYSYEDFIQGYRPSGEGFNLKDGIFFEFCQRAKKDQDAIYVFIIDEINRGNLSKILGELMILLEPDKRGAEWSMPLTYSATPEQQFSFRRTFTSSA